MSSADTPAGAPAGKKNAERKAPKSVEGVVISAKMQKTITVEMEHLEMHPKYGKYVRRHIRFKAHDEEGKAKEGDKVRIVQTRPISLTKRWRLVEVVARAKQ